MVGEIKEYYFVSGERRQLGPVKLVIMKRLYNDLYGDYIFAEVVPPIDIDLKSIKDKYGVDSIGFVYVILRHGGSMFPINPYPLTVSLLYTNKGDIMEKGEIQRNDVMHVDIGELFNSDKDGEKFLRENPNLKIDNGK
jgi:hypothetical protein